jgi:hypothetical protein
LTGPLRRVVVCRAPEDTALADALHLELATRAIHSWPSGPEITAEYASAELVTRLMACDGLIALATPAMVAWPFALRAMRLARELSCGVLVLAVGLGDDALRPWLAQLPVEPDAVRVCDGAREGALAVDQWSPPPADRSSQVLEFAAARAELLRVASRGGRVGELEARGADPASLGKAALHLRAIGLIDFAGPLDDERTTFITVG